MANTNEPFRRIGSNSWEELLTKVNEVFQDPPDGCDPIDEIETPEECHRWAKEDIQEVHDKMNEMPGDCFEFEPIPDLWKKSIIDNIEEQLENAWCDCEDEDCLKQCGNALPGNFVEIFLETICVTDQDCALIEECTEDHPDIDNCNDLHNEWRDQKDIYDDEKKRFSDNFREACYRQTELKELNAELNTLETQLEGLTDPDDIEAKEAEIAAKEAEIADVQAEFDMAVVDRDEALGLYLAAGQMMTDLYFEAGESICADYVPLGVYLEGLSFPPTDAVCYDKQPPGEEDEPPPDPITGIGAECFSLAFVGPGTGIFGGPFRCDVKWLLDERVYDTVRKRCNLANNDAPLSDSGWKTALRGEFNINGDPIITDWIKFSGCPEAKMFAYCAGSNCGEFACFGRPSKCAAPNSQRCTDYRIRLVFKTPLEFDCDGGPCGDGVNDGFVG